jgi:hypothetical protein
MISIAIALSLLACGTQEEGAINAYLKAVRDKDDAARGAVSSLSFPGEVSGWEIVEMGAETTETFRLPELRRAVKEAKADYDTHIEKRGYFMRDNARIYKEHKARLEENPDATFKGELAEFDEQWKKSIQEEQELEVKMQEANAAMQRERNTATISIMGGSVTEDFEGEVLVRKAQVNVDGIPYRFTVCKYNIVDKTTNNMPRSRWIITDIQKQS